MKYDYCRKTVQNNQVSLKQGKNKEYQYTFLITSRSVLLGIKNAAGKRSRGNQNANFMFNNAFENCTIYEKMWKNIVERGRPRVTLRRMRIACWIPTATNTHTVCVTIIAFPLQQW
jgi:hypothetical protein